MSDAAIVPVGPTSVAVAQPHASAAAAHDHVSVRHWRNIVALGTAQIITWSFVLAWTFIVPRHLGPASWGMIVTGSAIGGILFTCLGMGTRNFLVREMVRSSRSPLSVGRLLGTASVTRALFILPAAALLAVYLRVSNFGGTEVLVISIAAGAVFFQFLSEPFQALFQAVQRMEFLAGADVVDKATQSLGAIALVLAGFGAVAVSIWWLAVGALVLSVNVVWSRRFTRVRLRTDVARMRRLLLDSLPYWTMGLFLTFYTWIDSAMLATMTPPQVVGWYGVPTRLFGTMLFAATIVSTVWLPRLVAAHEDGEQAFRALARAPFEQLVMISLPIACGGAIVSGPVIRSLYGPAFEQAVPVLAILAVCVIPLYANIMVNQMLVASGRQVIWTKVMIAASVLNPLINLVAIRVTQDRFGNGAIGAAASLLATETLIMVVSLGLIARGILGLRSLLRAGRTLVATLGMGAAVYAVQRAGVLVEIPVGAAVFVALAVLFRVPDEEDRRVAGAVLARLTRRLRGAR